MSPEEVRLILNGWLESQSQLALVVNVFRVAVAVRCRVTAVSDFWVQFSTVGNGSLAIALFDPEAIFRYSEPREFSELSERLGLSAEQRFASALTVLFSSEEDSSERESLTLMELVD